MGWAAGFQAGSRAAKDALDTYYTTKERLELEKAMGLKPQELTSSRAASPEEMSRAEAETSQLAAKDIRDFGLTPQDQQMYAPAMPQEGQRVGLTSYQLGNQTFNRQPTQAEIDAARYTAAADVVALRNPLEAQRMRLAATQEQRAAQGFESEQKLRGLQIKEAERKDEAESRYASFNAFAAQNPDLTATQLREAAFKDYKFSPEQWEKAVTTRLNIKKGELDTFKANIKEKLQGKNLAQLGSLYNSDPDFDDKTDLAIVPGKGGSVTLNFIDKASGKITGTQSFKNEALAVEYLNNQAVQPETAGSWLLGVQAKQQQIAASEASAAKDYALGNYYSGGGAGGTKSLKGKIEMFKEVYGRDPTEKEKGQLAGLVQKDSSKPEFNPKEYAATIKSFTDAGLSLPDATVRADELYGRVADANSEIEALAALNDKKGKGLAKNPVEVRAGESRMTEPGAAVRGPTSDFVRESRRNLLGGVEYFYTDPVTKRRYTTEQYNQLLSK